MNGGGVGDVMKEGDKPRGVRARSVIEAGAMDHPYCSTVDQ